jgi:hypothetical protein
LDEGLEVVGFIVGDVVVPAAPEDTQLFEGEATEDGLVAFAGAFLLLVVRFRPRAFRDGLTSPLVERLPQKRRGIPTKPISSWRPSKPESSGA